MQLPLCKSVELSTSHITENDSQILSEMAGAFSETRSDGPTRPAVLATRYGFVIVIGQLTADGIIKNGASSELVSILNYCLKPEHGIVYLAFDSDGEKIDELAQFEW